jgi:hypothetical protein
MLTLEQILTFDLVYLPISSVPESLLLQLQLGLHKGQLNVGTYILRDFTSIYLRANIYLCVYTT